MSATEPQTNMILVKVSPLNNHLLCIHVNVKWFKWKFWKKKLFNINFTTSRAPP